MSYNDSIADLITRIRNGYLASLPYVRARLSKICVAILVVLKKNGYILDFVVENSFDIQIMLKYSKGNPAINDICRISKLGRRVYAGFKDLHSHYKYYNGYATAILSTSKGILSNVEAKNLNIGGEVLFYVF